MHKQTKNMFYNILFYLEKYYKAYYLCANKKIIIIILKLKHHGKVYFKIG